MAVVRCKVWAGEGDSCRVVRYSVFLKLPAHAAGVGPISTVSNSTHVWHEAEVLQSMRL
jgi:hypothetical protein